METVEKMAEISKSILNAPAGYYGCEPLDAEGGMKPGDVTTIFGSPGSGKSYAMIRMALRNFHKGHNIVFITGEADVHTVLHKISEQELIDPSNLVRGTLTAVVSGDWYAKIYVFNTGLHKSVAEVYDFAKTLPKAQVYFDPAPLGSSRGSSDFITAVKKNAMGTGIPAVVSYQAKRVHAASLPEHRLDDLGNSMDVVQLSNVVFLLSNEAGSKIKECKAEVVKNRSGGLHSDLVL